MKTYWSITNGEFVRNEVQLSPAERQQILQNINRKYNVAPVAPPMFCRQCKSKEVFHRDSFCSDACREIHERSQQRAKQTTRANFKLPPTLAWTLILAVGAACISFSPFCTKGKQQAEIRQSDASLQARKPEMENAR